MQSFLIFVLATFTYAADQIPFSSSTVDGIPMLGFGTWNLARDNASDVVEAAIKANYKHIDAAAIYRNEVEVGKGILRGLEATKKERSDLWITSKLWNDHHSPDLVPVALRKTLKDLQLDYLDLYHMHWPVQAESGKPRIRFLDTWKAMTELVNMGLVRHIGVSNFSPAQLQELIDEYPQDLPYAHQLEMHPYLNQSDFLAWHKLLGIHVTAYSPLGNMNPTYSTERKGQAAAYVPPLLENEEIVKIGKARGCTPAQVALQWGLTRGASVIPKSAHQDRIVENYQSYRCVLKDEDFDRLAKTLPTKRFNNPSKPWGVQLYEGLQDSGAAQALGGATLGKERIGYLSRAQSGINRLLDSLRDL